ncbi:transposase [Streptomyces sp. NPDC001500]
MWPAADHRQVIDRVLCRIRAGVQRRALLEGYGWWSTVYERHRRWSVDDSWESSSSGSSPRLTRPATSTGMCPWTRPPCEPTKRVAGARLAPPPRLKPGLGKAVGNARIRAELIGLLAEVVQVVRRSAAHAAASPPNST